MSVRRSHVRKGSISACLAAACLALGACGGEKVYPVQGTVTLDGTALPDASITFLPESDEGEPAFGWTDAEGKYSLLQGMRTDSGVTPGKYRVQISTYQQGKPQAEPPVPTVPEKLPTKYNDQTELVREVKAEENVLDFALDTQGEIVQPEPPEPF